MNGITDVHIVWRAKMPKSEKVHNSVKYSQNFTKVIQVICIIYQNSIHDIMIHPEAFLQIFC